MGFVRFAKSRHGDKHAGAPKVRTQL
jgi:hypothetical protein